MNKLNTLTEQTSKEFLLVYPLSAKTFP